MDDTATPGLQPFGLRLSDAMAAHGPLCVGVDPHPGLLRSWGLPVTLQGVRTFALTCVEAFGDRAAVVKPQSAFFEAYGSAGVALLEEVLDGLREQSTLSLLDVKRGDIGSTMGAYAEAYLGALTPGQPDAVTLSPYLGYGSLRPALDLARAHGRGVFVLTLTSNPEGAAVQHALLDGRSVAGHVVDGVSADNAEARSRGELGSVGMVVGATVGTAVQDLRLDLAASAAPLLAPGFGAQGGTAEELRRVFAGALPQVLASSSREVLGAGPDVEALRSAYARSADAVRAMVAPG